MALKLSDAVQRLKAVVADHATPADQRSVQIFELAADFILRAFIGGNDLGQVSILMVEPDSDQLSFVFPPHLSSGNAVPIARSSIAGRVLMDNRTLSENKVQEVEHHDFFERIPNAAGEVRTIQKMLACPVPGPEGRAIGVIEASRTGASPETAGRDFTPQDERNLHTTCRALAPFMAAAWKQKCLSRPASHGVA